MARLPVDASPTNECQEDGKGRRCDINAIGKSRRPVIAFLIRILLLLFLSLTLLLLLLSTCL